MRHIFQTENCCHKLIYPTYNPSNEEREKNAVYWNMLSRAIVALRGTHPRNAGESEAEWFAEHYVNSTTPERGTFRNALLEFAAGIGMRYVTVLTPPKAVMDGEATEQDVTVSLVRLPVVDTSRASWEQIMELRRDDAAKSKLRRLRLFLHKNYKDKSMAFVEDDISQRLEDHRRACADHGFETRLSVYSTLLDAKNMLSALSE